MIRSMLFLPGNTPNMLINGDALGADAVLVNTAIAVAQDPVAMARAFRLAVEAGRTAFEAKLAPVSSAAHATSPIQPLLDDVLSLK